MMLETIFGVAAGVLTSIRLFPQLYKTIKIKKTDDLSLWFLILLFFQALLLIGYGLTKPDMYIVFMNIVPLICSCILLELKHAYSLHAKEFSHEPRSHSTLFTLRQKLNAKTPHLKKVFFIHQYISK
jgi:uncharacterized protein with PQ loop repeat